MDKVQIRRALISVFDKTGIVELAKLLHEKGIEIISTGGTAKTLRDADIPIREVSDLTGFPEMMDGRLKTLHPKVHGGLLAIRSNKEHIQAMDDHGIVPIDLLVVNLYPFGDPNEMARLPYHEAVERIDIGGPAMIRAAAKNHGSVAVVTHPRQYPSLHERIATDGATSGAYRAHLMRDAFKLTFEFDKRVHDSFSLRILHNL